MTTVNSLTIRYLSACMMAGVLGYGSPAGAAKPTPDPVPDIVLLPQGVACPDFAVRVSISGGQQVFKEFVDKEGNVVRALFAGSGTRLLLESLDEDGTVLGTFSSKGGSVFHVTYNPDGTQTWRVTGHNLIVFLPSDIPAGPSTTLYVGQVIYTIDQGVSTLEEVKGSTTDVCAALTP